MKFQTNFSFPFGRLIPALSMAAWALALLALFAGFSMAWIGGRDRAGNPALEGQLAQLRQTPVAQVFPAPPEKDLAGLKTRLNSLGALGAGTGPSIPSVLSQLEALLPPGARLAAFQQDQRSGQIQLTVEATGLDILSEFLSALEKDGTFTRVELAKQGRSAQDNLIQFSLDMEARP